MQKKKKDTKTIGNKRKVNILDLSNKNFCVSNDTITRVKKQSMEWEKIFANHMSGKGLISRIHNKLTQLTNEIFKTLSFEKLGKGLESTFSKENTHVTNKHFKICLTPPPNNYRNTTQNHKEMSPRNHMDD